MLSYETIFKAVAEEFETQLTLAIDAVNLENTDFQIDQVPPAAFMYGSLNEEVVNYPQFVLGYIESVDSQTEGNAVARTVAIEFDIAVSRRSDNQDYFRILRYWEALTRAGQEVWGRILQGYGNSEIDILAPIQVTLFDGSEDVTVIGVKLTTTVFN